MKTLSRRAFVALLAASATAARAGGDAGWDKLLDPAGLAALIRAGGATVIDIRGAGSYADGHVAGALSAPYGNWRGPRENPGAALSDDALSERLQSLGLTPASAVVVTYRGRDQTSFGAAARVYWTLRSAGLTRLAILNGGLKAWRAAGMALSTEVATAIRSAGRFTLSEEWRIDAAGVRAVLEGRVDAMLIDARPAAFFEGRRKHPAATRAGTLEGAVNLTYATWFKAGETRIDEAAPVRARLAAIGRDAADPRPLVGFCNTGQWASINWFMFSEVAGIEGVKLYPESMVGWTRAGGAAVNGG